MTSVKDKVFDTNCYYCGASATLREKGRTQPDGSYPETVIFACGASQYYDYGKTEALYRGCARASEMIKEGLISLS